MTKKLSELFNLPEENLDSSTNIESIESMERHQATIEAVDQAIDKIDAALPLVNDLDAGDQELDELADLAKDKFNELVNLGFNVEPRYSGVILQTASTLLGHAITAKQAKMDKKLRMIQLQLSKAKLDHAIEKENPEKPVEGHGIMLDRNELLKAILNKNSK